MLILNAVGLQIRPSGVMQKSKNAQSQYTLNTNNILFGF